MFNKNSNTQVIETSSRITENGRVKMDIEESKVIETKNGKRFGTLKRVNNITGEVISKDINEPVPVIDNFPVEDNIQDRKEFNDINNLLKNKDVIKQIIENKHPNYYIPNLTLMEAILFLDKHFKNGLIKNINFKNLKGMNKHPCKLNRCKYNNNNNLNNRNLLDYIKLKKYKHIPLEGLQVNTILH